MHEGLEYEHVDVMPGKDTRCPSRSVPALIKAACSCSTGAPAVGPNLHCADSRLEHAPSHATRTYLQQRFIWQRTQREHTCSSALAAQATHCYLRIYTQFHASALLASTVAAQAVHSSRFPSPERGVAICPAGWRGGETLPLLAPPLPFDQTPVPLLVVLLHRKPDFMELSGGIGTVPLIGPSSSVLLYPSSPLPSPRTPLPRDPKTF